LNFDEFDDRAERYVDKERDKGAGPCRIGTQCLFKREDLYTYIFVSCFHPEYIYAGD